MSALLALGLVYYGLVAFAPAHAETRPTPPAAGFSIRIDPQAREAHHHAGAVVHVHGASPFVTATASALAVTGSVVSVAYLRLQAARTAVRATAPPLRPPRTVL